MSLVRTADLLKQAQQEKYAVGAFNVANMEMAMGVIVAAEEISSPVILQIAEGRLNHSPLHLIGSMLVAAARQARIPVGVNFDHGKDATRIAEALNLGFSSVMVDYSHASLSENIAITNEVYALAHSYGASTEAEIGIVGGSEDDSEILTNRYSKVEDIRDFLAHARFDALAVAIGNAHGRYNGEPKLNFSLLEEISGLTDIPLVLHGGTGISREDFQKAIHLGICKVNIATSSFEAIFEEITLNALSYRNFFDMSVAMVKATKKNALMHMKMFGSENQAR